MDFLGHKSLLTALITAVLAIGGCLPCQKLFAGEPSKKSCCNSKGECQRPSPESPSKKVCNLQVADMQTEPQPQSDRLTDGILAGAGRAVAPLSLVLYPAAETPGNSNADLSPPPLFLSNLCLLI